MSKFEGKSSIVNQVIFSAPTSIPNKKALAQILFEISSAQDFQILFLKGYTCNSRKRHNFYLKKKNNKKKNKKKKKKKKKKKQKKKRVNFFFS